MIIHARPIARSIVRSAAVSITLFALAACGSGGGGGDSDTSSSAPPAPSTAARKVVLEVGSEECQYGGILVQTGIDDNRNGALDDNEVDASEAVCNGAPRHRRNRRHSHRDHLLRAGTDL